MTSLIILPNTTDSAELEECQTEATQGPVVGK